MGTYPRYLGLPQGRLLVDNPVARARGFARLRKEAEGTYPPLGLEALSPVYALPGQSASWKPRGWR